MISYLLSTGIATNDAVEYAKDFITVELTLFETEIPYVGYGSLTNKDSLTQSQAISELSSIMRRVISKCESAIPQLQYSPGEVSINDDLITVTVNINNVSTLFNLT